MDNKDSFFSNRNTVRDVTAADVQNAGDYLEVVKAFSRATNQSIYIIDYQKKGFEYVSDNPLFLSGHTAEEVCEMGYEFYFKYVPSDDLELLLKINTVGFDFYETLPLEDRKDYSISYDFHLTNNEGKLILINQKLTPIFLTEEGKIWKAICLVSLSTEQNYGNIIIQRNRYNETYKYDLSSCCWRRIEKIELSDREKEILRFSIRGYSINEISEKLFISSDTVKFHRRKLFEKLEVSNISEAISYASQNELI
ncbi:LuxR C-terminal-related transcriptional regulator [Marivirga tractuosa]|uniref:helix-turn-helix transcriptional regulator n=1 Tax=Marivirga tractuosa TaxID=1006 RepID=UPI0035CECEF2